MRIAVVDGQGGGIGKAIVEKVRKAFDDAEIIALGTNSLATSQMLKAGANEGATGENAIARNVSKADYILGSVSIISANSFLGELTPVAAGAIADSPAKKVLIPLNKSNIVIAGLENKQLPHYIDDLIEIIKSIGV